MNPSSSSQKDRLERKGINWRIAGPILVFCVLMLIYSISMSDSGIVKGVLESSFYWVVGLILYVVIDSISNKMS